MTSDTKCSHTSTNKTSGAWYTDPELAYNVKWIDYKDVSPIGKTTFEQS